MENVMLIVDDVDMNRDILKVLFQANYEILEAEDGEEALEVLERCQGSIDMVLLDLMMPGMDGFELLKKRKELDSFREVPVVVITGSGQMEDQVKAFELGANDFIVKPFVPEIVISRVNNVMSSNRRMLSIEQEAKKLRIKSELDEMTGLYNKTTTELMMNETLKTGGGQLNVLMVIDIDYFKAVNDSSGHQTGDHVIKIIADLISSLFRKTDIVGRIGGDEFCVLMVDVPSMNIVYEKVNELIQIMRYKPNLTIPEYVTLSIGMAANGHKNSSYGRLFRRADEALYQAKKGGKAQYREYGVEPINMEHDNRRAVLLLSDNRSVCSAIHALIPTQIRIIESLWYDDLEKLDQKDIDKIQLAYVDVSDYEEDMDTYWEKIRSLPWLAVENTFAVCEEGNVSQYMSALKNGVADIITTPIDNAAFKRRMQKQLEKLNLTE